MNNMGDSGSPFRRLLELLKKITQITIHKTWVPNGRYATIDLISSSNVKPIFNITNVETPSLHDHIQFAAQNTWYSFAFF